MPWPPNNYVTGQLFDAPDINAISSALRTWGGDVNAGGYNLSNVNRVSASSASIGGAANPQGIVEIDQNSTNGGVSLFLNQPINSWGTGALFASYRYIRTASQATDGNFKEFHVGAGGVTIGYPATPTYGSPHALYVNGYVGVGTNAPQGALHIVDQNSHLNLANPVNGPSGYNASKIARMVVNQFAGDSTMGGLTLQRVDRATGTFEANLLSVNLNNGYVGFTGLLNPTQPIHLSGGAYCTGTVWTNASSSRLKTDFAPISPDEILSKIRQLDIQSWRYAQDPEDVRRIGPTAEDWHRVFQLGGDPEAIGTVEAIGAALAAIQALAAQLDHLKTHLNPPQSNLIEENQNA